jgi:hypothetical protein
LSAWISGPESVTVGPGESREVAIKIAIPANAEPGGHFAAVFFQTTPPTGDDNAGRHIWYTYLFFGFIWGYYVCTSYFYSIIFDVP